MERAGVRYAEHVIYEEPLFVYPLLFYGSRFEIMAEAFTATARMRWEPCAGICVR